MCRLLLVFTSALTLLSYPAGIAAQLPNGQCAAEDVSCRIEEDNLQGITTEANDINECLENASEATFVSYFGHAGFPFRDTCLYFSSCDTLDVCEDCQSLDISSSCDTCSAPVEGSLGSNLVNIIDDISEELTCKLSCVEDPSCSVYTHHGANSTFSPETCFLLSGIAAPVRECVDDTCRTGLPDCPGFSICAYLEDGVVMKQGVMIKEGEKNIDLLRLGVCPSPVAVAIGGGGIGYNGGGGSGYVSHSVLPPASYIKLLAFAGGPGEDSYLKEVDSNTNILSAEKGEDAQYYPEHDGGAGYSGGGGYGDCGGGHGGSATRLELRNTPLRGRS